MTQIDPENSPSSCLCVLGMHRSGTSALTAVLAAAGADPGSSLMPADPEINPKGFWEHMDVVTIHDKILNAFDSSWDDERPLPDGWWRHPEIGKFRDELLGILQRDFSSTPLWLLKDPRVCRLLPLWLGIFRDARVLPYFVICLRHPYEVAKSLEKRDGIQRERACMLWLQHVLDSERETRGFPRTVITYEELLSGWRAVLHRIESDLGIEFAHHEDIAKDIESFLDPSLRHHQPTDVDEVSGGAMQALADDLYSLLASEERHSASARLAAIAEKTQGVISCVNAWSAEIHMLRKQGLQLRKQNIHLKEVLDRICKHPVTGSVIKLVRFLKRDLSFANPQEGLPWKSGQKDKI